MGKSFKAAVFSLLQLMTAISLVWNFTTAAPAQERRGKTRISNAAFTITALPLLAARDWRIFPANGLDMEIILMNSALVPPALVQGDIDYQAGVGPASVNATLSGFPTRAIWFSSDKISYWLMSRSPYKTLESLKGKKIAIQYLIADLGAATDWKQQDQVSGFEYPPTLNHPELHPSGFSTRCVILPPELF